MATWTPAEPAPQVGPAAKGFWTAPATAAGFRKVGVRRLVLRAIGFAYREDHPRRGDQGVASYLSYLTADRVSESEARQVLE